MANPTMTLIASNIVGSGGVSSVTFSSIPQTYTNLVVKMSVRDTSSGGYNNSLITFNGSSTGYSEIEIGYNGSSVYSASQSTTSLQFDRIDGNGATSNTFSNNELYIPNYTSSNYKSISADNVTETNGSSITISLGAQLWSNTAAITSITIAGASASFVQYSTFYLYGINNS